METAVQCIEKPAEPEKRLCPYCDVPFLPRTRWQAFCSVAHRNAYDVEIGALGRVASVRRLRRGVSVVVHLADGPAAERALNLEIGTSVRVVKAHGKG